MKILKSFYKSNSDRRRYIRIHTVIPIEFYLLDSKNIQLTPWLQGFSKDLSKGGICLCVNDLWEGFWERFTPKEAVLFLRINLPFKREPIFTKAKVIWKEKKPLRNFNQYFLGLEFLDVSPQIAKLIFSYAVFKKLLPLATSFFIFIVLFVFFFSFGKNIALNRENRNLVKKYVDLLEKTKRIENSLSKDTLTFQERMNYLKKEIEILEKELTISQEKSSLIEVENLKKRLELLKKEEEVLNKKEKEKREYTFLLKKKREDLEKEKLFFSQKIIEGLFNWIKNRQNLHTGLVLSYEGDYSLERICFTYDQALSAITFLIFKDKEKAEKIFDFYLNKDEIYNAYYSNGEVAEAIVHSGPKIWLGIAVLNYIKITQDKKYLKIVEKIADFLLQTMDSEGGIKGAPNVSWYSTEHNLDAYAFFELYYELSNEPKYLEAKEKIKNWLLKYAYSIYGIPVKRGKGDSTIATDTYAWSITALGPQVLFSLNMNPNSILEFAVENCEVETNFSFRDKEFLVRGFDFAKIKNLARGGVISCEWTAQMILAFQIMADYYKNRDIYLSEDYIKKVIFYSNELQKMLITSFSRFGKEDPCLPYASQADVDTGHGWRTPKGNRTGSLSATSYFLFVYLGYNPLKAEYLENSLKNIYEEFRDKTIAKVD